MYHQMDRSACSRHVSSNVQGLLQSSLAAAGDPVLIANTSEDACETVRGYLWIGSCLAIVRALVISRLKTCQTQHTAWSRVRALLNPLPPATNRDGRQTTAWRNLCDPHAARPGGTQRLCDRRLQGAAAAAALATSPMVCMGPPSKLAHACAFPSRQNLLGDLQLDKLFSMKDETCNFAQHCKSLHAVGRYATAHNNPIADVAKILTQIVIDTGQHSPRARKRLCSDLHYKLVRI